MTRNLRILAEFAGDWLIAMALVIIACAGSGWCQHHLTPNNELYLTWFSVWLIPFVMYTDWRLKSDLPSWQFWAQLVVVLASCQSVWIFRDEIDPSLFTAILFATSLASFLIGQWMFPDLDEPGQTGNVNEQPSPTSE